MGSLDIPLNQSGREQAHYSAKYIMNKNIHYIISSPLQRARETAQIIASYINKKVIIFNELQECNWGIYEGQPIGKGEVFDRWFAGEVIIGGESLNNFELRVSNGIRKILDLDNTSLVVAHSGVYLAIQRFFNLEIIRPKNCELIFHQFKENSLLRFII